jgi:uncharacterized protein YhhL (DUF1145 family)
MNIFVCTGSFIDTQRASMNIIYIVVLVLLLAPLAIDLLVSILVVGDFIRLDIVPDVVV